MVKTSSILFLFFILVSVPLIWHYKYKLWCLCLVYIDNFSTLRKTLLTPSYYFKKLILSFIKRLFKITYCANPKSFFIWLIYVIMLMHSLLNTDIFLYLWGGVCDVSLWFPLLCFISLFVLNQRCYVSVL